MDLSVQVPTIAIPRAFPYTYLQSQPLGPFRTRNYHCNLSDFSPICIFNPNFSDLSVRVPVLVMHYKGFLLIVSFKSLLQCHPLKILTLNRRYSRIVKKIIKKRKEKFNSWFWFWDDSKNRNCYKTKWVDNKILRLQCLFLFCLICTSLSFDFLCVFLSYVVCILCSMKHPEGENKRLYK